MKLFAFLLTLSTVAGVESVLEAQTPTTVGVLTGEVLDAQTKEPIPSANVIIVGTTIGAATDINGMFRIPNVPVGIYAVRASVIGYRSNVRSDVVVSVARPFEIRFEMLEASIELGEVTVSAEYFQKLPESPLSTQTQSSEEIRRLPGSFEDVVRAISILPGVAQVDPGRNDLIVRGGAPSENLYVIDNIEVPNINHFGTQGASGGPLSFVNLDFVQNTSFSTGGFGVRYGDRLSSVLSINLRDGRTDRLGGKATISASQFGLNLEGPFSDNGSFLFSARRSYLDFIFKAAGFGFVPEYWDFLGKAHYHLGTSDRINVLAIGALDNVKFFNDTPDKRYENSKILGSNQNQAVGGVSWRHLFESGYTTVTLGQTYVDYEYGQSDSLQQPVFRSNSVEQEWSLRGDVVYQISKKTEVSFGVQAKRARFLSNIDLKPFWTNFGQLLSVNAHYTTNATKASFYGSVTQTVGPIRLTAGLRGDYFDLIKEKTVLAPRASASLELSPSTTATLSIGRYYQAPSYIWLTAYPENRMLNHIVANQYIVGIDHIIRGDTKISLEVYLKRYSRYPASLDRPFLVLANTGAGFGGSDDGYASFGLDHLVSRGTGEAKGAEVFVQKKFSEIPCYGTFSVSYNDSRFRALDGIERPNSFDQRWIVNLGGGYVFNEAWEFSAKFRYATGRPYTPVGLLGAQSASLYNSARLGVNHSLDVRVERRWQFSTWTLVTYVDIQNIYNRKPAMIPRYDLRTGMLEDNDAIGILPSIGISAEF